MGGVIGATSGKFVLMGAALLLHGRVDDIDSRVAIVPGAPTSAISQRLADRLHRGNGPSDLKIHLRAETLRAKIAAVEPDIGTNAELRIGQDVLNETPVELDFAHRDLLPLSPSEARAFERRAQPIAVQQGVDGTMRVNVTIGKRDPFTVPLDLSSTRGLVLPDATTVEEIKVGGVTVRGVEVTTGSKPVVGLYAFRDVRVLFDLGHGHIWIRS